MRGLLGRWTKKPMLVMPNPIRLPFWRQAFPKPTVNYLPNLKKDGATRMGNLV